MRWFVPFIFLWVTVPGLAAPDSVLMRQVDTAPQIKSEENLPKLVKHLTQNLKKDEDKAYALLAWIVKNIDYDSYKEDQIEQKKIKSRSRAEIPEAGDILKTRLGVCEDIATLYQKMLTEAKMKAVLISGCTDGIHPRTRKCKDEDPGHAWNAVWIDHQWEFVDPTWAITGKQTGAMQDITKKRNYEKELKKREKRTAHTYEARPGRSVNEQWFMTDPKIMKESHQPKEEKWQLTKSKDRRNKNL